MQAPRPLRKCRRSIAASCCEAANEAGVFMVYGKVWARLVFDGAGLAPLSANEATA